MTTDEYVPDEHDLEVAWIEFEASADDINAASAEFDRFLARVRRDAAREALDGLAAWMSDLHDKYPSHAWYVPLSLDNIAHYTTDNYPEETP